MGNDVRRRRPRGDGTPYADTVATPPSQPPVFSLVAAEEEKRARQARQAAEDLRRKREREEELEKARKKDMADKKEELRRVQQQRKELDELHAQQQRQREEEQKRKTAAEAAANFAAISERETRAKQQRRDNEDRINKEKDLLAAAAARSANDTLERQRMQAIIDEQRDQIENMTKKLNESEEARRLQDNWEAGSCADQFRLPPRPSSHRPDPPRLPSATSVHPPTPITSSPRHHSRGSSKRAKKPSKSPKHSYADDALSNLREPADFEKGAATYRKTVAFNDAGRRHDDALAGRTTLTPSRTPFVADRRETDIRLAQLAMQQVKDSRPAEKFEAGSTAQYVALMKRFDTAVEIDGMTSRRKLMEMSFWFKGLPCRIAETFQSKDDDELAYTLARSALDNLFGQVDDTAVPALKAAAAGPQIKAEDHKGHLTLYTTLLEAQSLAEALRRSADLERRDLIMDIINKRLGHMAHTLIQKDLKAKRKGRDFGFQQLIDAVSEWTAVLQRSRPASNPSTSRVAAVESSTKPVNSNQRQRQQPASFADKVANSPPQPQSTIKCAVCDSFHETEKCNVLAALLPDQKVAKLREKGLCMHCLKHGHIARDCTEVPSCIQCHARHHTILHGRTPPAPRAPKKTPEDAAAKETTAPKTQGIPPIGTVVTETPLPNGNSEI